jgi:hypothetical protein
MPSVFLSYSHNDEAWKDRLRTHIVYPPQLYVPQRMVFQEGREESATDDALVKSGSGCARRSAGLS